MRDDERVTGDDMSKANFNIVMYGDEIDEAGMDMEYLAGAMSNTSRLIRETASKSTAQGFENSKLSIKIKGFERGSIIEMVELTYHDGLLPSLLFLGSQQVSGLINLLQLIGFVKGTGQSLIGVVKRLGNPDTVLHKANNKLYLKSSDGNVLDIEVSDEVAALLMPQMTAIVKELTKCSTNNYTNGVRFTSQYSEPVEIDKDDAQLIAKGAEKIGEERIILHEEERTTVIQVIRPDFTAGNKWYVASGSDGPRYYTDVDVDLFNAKIKSRDIRIGAGDIWKVKMVTTAYRLDNVFHEDNKILELIELVG